MKDSRKVETYRELQEKESDIGLLNSSNNGDRGSNFSVRPYISVNLIPKQPHCYSPLLIFPPPPPPTPLASSSKMSTHPSASMKSPLNVLGMFVVSVFLWKDLDVPSRFHFRELPLLEIERGFLKTDDAF